MNAYREAHVLLFTHQNHACRIKVLYMYIGAECSRCPHLADEQALRAFYMQQFFVAHVLYIACINSCYKLGGPIGHGYVLAKQTSHGDNKACTRKLFRNDQNHPRILPY